MRRADEFRKLHQPADVANSGVKRVKAFWRVELVLREEALTERRHAEIYQAVLESRAAMAASHRLADRSHRVSSV